MSLVPMKEMLIAARKSGYAVGMFGVFNYESCQAAVQAAEKMRSPAILGLGEAHAPSALERAILAPMVVEWAKKSGVPIAVHLDHGLTIGAVKDVLASGFSAIMIDGSALSYEDNIAITTRAVDMARPTNATVEGELGHVKFLEGGEDDGMDGDMYTQPELVAPFIERTGVDVLAVAIGTIHGHYKTKPKLDYALLNTIARLTDAPLALHGGSGLSDADLQKCIAGGISKVNIYTDLIDAAKAAMIDLLKEKDFFYSLKYVIPAMQAVAMRKMEILGSAGRA